MDDKDLKLKLLAGIPIEVENAGFVHPLTLREMASIGETKYQEYLGMLLLSKKDLKQIDDIGDLQPFDLIGVNSYHNESFKETIEKALSILFNDSVKFTLDSESFFYVIGENGRLDNSNFNLFREIIIKQNCISEKEQDEEGFKAGNEMADEFAKQMEELKNKYKKFADKKNNPTLRDLVSAVAWKSDLGINKVFDLTIYQLYDAIDRLNIVDTYHNVMTGIYTGNIEFKKNDMKDINWLKPV